MHSVTYRVLFDNGNVIFFFFLFLCWDGSVQHLQFWPESSILKAKDFITCRHEGSEELNKRYLTYVVELVVMSKLQGVAVPPEAKFSRKKPK